MSPETRSVLATTFAVIAIFAALLSATVSALTAVNLTKQVQTNRRDLIVNSCQSQNTRNRKAYVFLSALPTNPHGPQMSHAQRIALIHGFTDALVGRIHPDCIAYADSLTHP